MVMQPHWLIPRTPYESYAAWREVNGGSAAEVAFHRTPAAGPSTRAALASARARWRWIPNRNEVGVAPDRPNAGKRLLTLIDDILDLSKVEAGHLSLERQEFDPGAVMEQVATTAAHGAFVKGLELVLDIDERARRPHWGGSAARRSAPHQSRGAMR